MTVCQREKPHGCRLTNYLRNGTIGTYDLGLLVVAPRSLVAYAVCEKHRTTSSALQAHWEEQRISNTHGVLRFFPFDCGSKPLALRETDSLYRTGVWHSPGGSHDHQHRVVVACGVRGKSIFQY